MVHRIAFFSCQAYDEIVLGSEQFQGGALFVDSEEGEDLIVSEPQMLATLAIDSRLLCERFL